jgi:D-alanyl-D-alanine dipeptidase
MPQSSNLRFRTATFLADVTESTFLNAKHELNEAQCHRPSRATQTLWHLCKSSAATKNRATGPRHQRAVMYTSHPG